MAQTLFTDLVTLIQSSWLNDVDAATYNALSSVAGTNTITATGPTTVTAYAANQRFFFTPAITNTSATTLNISSIGAKNVFWNGIACVGGELRASIPVLVAYDGTQFHIVGNGFATPAKRPTRQVLTSGTAATYTTPANATHINVRMVGGGGGGAGSGVGGDGTASTWSGGSLSAGGGTGGSNGSNGGVAGTSANGDINLSGGSGSGAVSIPNRIDCGANGGNSFYGGGGGGGAGSSGPGAGGAGATNTGGGGGGGGCTSTGTPGSGGGAGGFCEKLITAPAATYTYTVGAAGAAGTSAAQIAAGGLGGTGLIVVDEWYD